MEELLFNLEIDEEDGSAEILVEGIIGEKNYCFLLDTGAAKTSVKTDDYIAKYHSIGESHSNGVFSSLSEQKIVIPNIEVGPLIKENFTICRTNENLDHKKNLIGMDFLKEYSYCFYFDENKIMVNQNTELLKMTLEDLVLDRKGYQPYINVHYGETMASAVWDTGAGITVVDVNFIKNNPSYFEEIGTSMGTDSTGTSINTPEFLMSSTIIGKHRFPFHRVVGVDLSRVNSTAKIRMDLILGYSTLSKANWFFDFPREKWAILSMLE
ncbi:hypothetical protein GH741_11225 [Aquibacillus halophilus]|uniref:Peptidase A2 domain-containing protein n=1 Tax=Aquibacillus halophilus TaxID=930132 RepID=A0A6A8DHQ6_9BACI|nr:hypothetical protein [Aquibacillus halophilus]MRH43251.1 hypothetical protein [Aquibacillus halophilus]